MFTGRILFVVGLKVRHSRGLGDGRRVVHGHIGMHVGSGSNVEIATNATAERRGDDKRIARGALINPYYFIGLL